MDWNEILYVSIITILSIIGFILDAWLLFNITRRRQLRKTTHHMIVMILLVLSFCGTIGIGIPQLLVLVFDLKYGPENRFQGAVGSSLCFAQGLLAHVTFGNIIIVHMTLALDRLYTIVEEFKSGRKFKVSTVIKILFVGNVLFLGQVFMLSWSTRKYIPSSCGYYCFLPTSNFQDRFEAAATISLMGQATLTISVLALCYLKIYMYTRRITEKLDLIQSYKLQRHVLWFCFLITMSFLVCYFPIVSTYLLKLAGLESLITLQVDMIVTSIATADLVVTPIVLLYLRPEYR